MAVEANPQPTVRAAQLGTMFMSPLTLRRGETIPVRETSCLFVRGQAIYTWKLRFGPRSCESGYLANQVPKGI